MQTRFVASPGPRQPDESRERNDDTQVSNLDAYVTLNIVRMEILKRICNFLCLERLRRQGSVKGLAARCASLSVYAMLSVSSPWSFKPREAHVIVPSCRDISACLVRRDPAARTALLAAWPRAGSCVLVWRRFSLSSPCAGSTSPGSAVLWSLLLRLCRELLGQP